MSQAIQVINILSDVPLSYFKRGVWDKWSYSACYHGSFILYNTILEPLLNAHEDK